MSLTGIATLLQLVLSLLVTMQSNPTLPQPTRDSAIQVAQSAVTQANTALSMNLVHSATFSASPTSGNWPLTVLFSAPADRGLSIGFGDGTTGAVEVVCTNSVPGTCSGTAAHTYKYPSTYTAHLLSDKNCLVMPDAGYRCSGGIPQIIGTATITVAAGQTNPQTFSASPTSGVAPLAVSFYFTKPSGDGQYTLDFGDGSSSSSWKAAFENANSLYQSHTYTSLGTYTVKLRRPPLPNEANCVGADCWVVGTATITVAAGQTSPLTFSTLNASDKSSFINLSNGNLTAVAGMEINTHNAVRSTLGMTSGKWYWEVAVSNGPKSFSNVNAVGVMSRDAALGPSSSGYVGGSDVGFGWGYATDSGIYYASGFSSSGTAPALSNGTKRFAYDADTGKLWIGDSTAWFGGGDPAVGTNPTATYASHAKAMYPAASLYFAIPAVSFTFNFGQTAFAFASPSGFNPLRQ
jgi:hypothetical protein